MSPPSPPQASILAPKSVVRRRGHIEELPIEKSALVEHQTETTAQLGETAESQPLKLRAPSAAAANEAEVQAEASRSSDQSFPDRQGQEISAAEWGARLAKVYPDPARPTPAHRPPVQTPSNPAATTSQTGKPETTPAIVSAGIRQQSSPDSLLKQETPVSVPSKTRRFLRPLVGIDPGTVDTYTGSTASKVAEAHNADAVAIGDAIALGAGNLEGEPRQLGLLAHELTHVARHRQPRFVPPIARGSSRAAGMHFENAVTSLARSPVETRTQSLGKSAVGVGDMPGDTTDEEALARRVEARVVQAAEDISRQDNEPLAASLSEHPLASTNVTVETPAVFSPVADFAKDEWGGLPAPWEPLPEWVTALPESSTPNTSSRLPGVNDSLGPSPVAATAPVQRAEAGRSLNEETSSSAAAVQEPGKAVAPDLDQLAKQVYAVLKRRLDSERRRQLF
jgi:hypothetical protein